jgi:solute carrier family 39 (zinc transporter), member 1/2/3
MVIRGVVKFCFLFLREDDRLMYICVSAELMTASLSTVSCAGQMAEADWAECRDDAAALRLKAVAMGAILLAGVLGVGLPLAGRKRRALRMDSAAFVAAKAFAAGVILATGFVHMLHDAERALSSSCLPAAPWREFPFPGFVAMSAALATLVLDFLATSFYESKHRDEAARVKTAAAAALAASSTADEDITVVTVDEDERKAPLLQANCRPHSHAHDHNHHHAHELAPSQGREEEVSAHVRSVVVSQVIVGSGCLGWFGASRNQTLMTVVLVADTGDGNRITLGDHWVVTGSVTKPMHNKAACRSPFVPPVL